jgi:predicted lipid carrier protein YhbT
MRRTPRVLPEATRVTRDGAPADATLSGPVSDLLLFLYGRIPFDGLEISGDTALIGRWQELSGTF